MVKKEVITGKSDKIFTENPIILLYHFNNVSTKNWQFVKKEIKKDKEIQALIIKNKIVTKKLIKKKELDLVVTKNNLSHNIVELGVGNYKKEKLSKNNNLLFTLDSLIQGPTFVIGCKTEKTILVVNNLFKASSNFLFIGGFYNGEKITYTGLDKIVSLNKSIKSDLLQFLSIKRVAFSFLKLELSYNLLQLIETIQFLVKSKKKVL